MVRNLALVSLLSSAVATKDMSLVQQLVEVHSTDYQEDYIEDYQEDDPRSGKFAGRFTGKGKDAPTVQPTPAPTVPPTDAPTVQPTPAPTDPPTMAPTAAGECWAYNDMRAIDVRYDGSVATSAGQLPYTNMVACQSKPYASKMYAARPLTNQVDNRWPGTCSHTQPPADDNRWWVQLASDSIVESIQITNRGDCCGQRLENVDIFVGGQLCGNTGKIAQGATVLYTCPTPLSGNVVELKSYNRDTSLTICGFQAYGTAR
jgi:hypothetical protein